MKFSGKTLEQTIRELGARYKNVPSPLSEQYRRQNGNIQHVPQQGMARGTDPRGSILGDFKPNTPNTFFR